MDEWMQCCDDADVVSFDIFDTLILRNVLKPTDIFEIMGEKIRELSWCDNFAELRIQAEADSRLHVQNSESNLDEIYQEIGRLLPDHVDEIKQMELETEKKFITENPFIKKIYTYCKSKQKKILFISDMYLSSEFIGELLRKCGYQDEKIFVSNEFRINKGSGGLYEAVQKECGLEKSRWLHIGDNKDSDYEQAKRFGIRALLYKNVSTYFTWDIPLNPTESIMAGIRNNLLFNGECYDYWEQFGIAYAFPIYMGFTKWLYDITCNEDNLFFLARDGYAIKQLYERICKKTGKKIETDYVYVSRNTLQIPVMALEPQMDQAIKLMTNLSGFRDGKPSVEEVLRTVRIYKEDVTAQMLHLFELQSMDEIVNQENYPKVQKLAAWLSDKVKKRLLEEKDLLAAYLDQHQMSRWDTINIMDIGWVGSCQDALEKLLRKKVRGYYFGTLDTSVRQKYCSMFGWVFDDRIPGNAANDIYRNGMMYEWLFSAPHGSTWGYEKKEDKIIPVMNRTSDQYKLIARFQKSALVAAEKCLEYLDYMDQLRPQVCLKPYREMIKNKREEDICHFKDLLVDSAPGCDHQYPYVVQVKKEDLYNRNWLELRRFVDRSFWEGAYYVEDADLSPNDKWIIKYVLNSEAYREDSIQRYYAYNLEFAKIYCDFGQGFNEKDSILVPLRQEGMRYFIDLDVDLDVKQFRIDPIEGKHIRIRNYAVKVDGKEHRVKVPGLVPGLPGRLRRIQTTDPTFLVGPAIGHITHIHFESDIVIM